MLVWLRSVPDQCSLSCLLIKLLSNSFLGEGFLFCVHEGVQGCEGSNWSQTVGQKAHMFLLPEPRMSAGLGVNV